MKNASVALAAALLAAAGMATAQGRQDLPERYLLGRVLLQPRPGLPAAELDRILKPHGGRRAQTIRQLNVVIVELPKQANIPAVVEALRRNRHIKFAEPDGVLEPAFYPNDPRYPYAWHLPKIGTPSAWDSTQGSGVTVAVLDSGVDASHPDLQGRLAGGWNFYDNNTNTTDVSGHGTAVAGIVAAAGNNALGVASVSFASRIMPMRVTDPSGAGYYSLMAAALTTAADNGARVANISFLGVSLSSTVDTAAQYMRSKGGVVVVSGGNTGDLRSEPSLPSLTVVSATTTADQLPAFSSWGDYIDIAAPGISIWTTLRGGTFDTVSGTSASAPVVAGVYALMMSAKPGLSPAVLDDILFSTAVDLGASGWDEEFGHGRVDAAAAVSRAKQTFSTDATPPTVTITSPTGGAASGLVPVDVDAEDDAGVTRVELLANGSLIATDTTAPYGFTVDAGQYGTGGLTLVARAYDAAGNVGESDPVELGVSGESSPPTVTILSPGDGATVSGTVTVNVSAEDDVKVAKITLDIDGGQVALSYGSTLSYGWKVPRGKGKGKGNSSSSITARAWDADGNVAAASITVSH